MRLDAGNLGWEAHRHDTNGADLDLDSDEAMECHQTHSAWMCGPELKNALQTGYSLRSSDSLITLLLMRNEWLQWCNFIFNKISSVLIAFSTFLPFYHSPLENTYSDYSGVSISSRLSNWVHPSHWMPAPWTAMMGGPTPPRPRRTWPISTQFQRNKRCLKDSFGKWPFSRMWLGCFHGDSSFFYTVIISENGNFLLVS